MIHPDLLEYQSNGPQACNFVKEETLLQVLSCEFLEIFKNIFFTEHFWAIISGSSLSFL